MKKLPHTFIILLAIFSASLVLAIQIFIHVPVVPENRHLLSLVNYSIIPVAGVFLAAYLVGAVNNKLKLGVPQAFMMTAFSGLLFIQFSVATFSVSWLPIALLVTWGVMIIFFYIYIALTRNIEH